MVSIPARLSRSRAHGPEPGGRETENVIGKTFPPLTRLGPHTWSFEAVIFTYPVSHFSRRRIAIGDGNNGRKSAGQLPLQLATGYIYEYSCDLGSCHDALVYKWRSI